MKKVFIFIFFSFGLICHTNTNAQTVATHYGLELKQQHIDVYAYFWALAKGSALTPQENTTIRQNVLTNFYANPVYIIADANNLLQAKSNPQQCAVVVNNYRMAIAQQQYAQQQYQQQYYNNPGYWQQMSDQSRELHNQSMRIIGNIGGGYTEERIVRPYGW